MLKDKVTKGCIYKKQKVMAFIHRGFFHPEIKPEFSPPTVAVMPPCSRDGKAG